MTPSPRGTSSSSAVPADTDTDTDTDPDTDPDTDGGTDREEVLTPGALVTAVVEDTGYRSELLAEGTIEALGRVENVDTLVGMAAEYRTLPSSWRPPRWWPTPTSSVGMAPRSP